MRYALAPMADRKTVKPAQATEAVRVAQRVFAQALETAKQLKTKSRDAKRRMKAAKKVAKQASKAARAAREAAEEARHAYKKAVARAARAHRKAAKATEKISTPNRTSPSRNHPRSSPRAERLDRRSRRRTWEVDEDEGRPDQAALTESASASSARAGSRGG